VSPQGYFPKGATFETETRDVFRDRVFGPAFAGTAALLDRLKWLQEGHVQVYVLYILVTLVLLIVFGLPR
jgi:hypothetical protein